MPEGQWQAAEVPRTHGADLSVRIMVSLERQWSVMERCQQGSVHGDREEELGAWVPVAWLITQAEDMDSSLSGRAWGSTTIELPLESS